MANASAHLAQGDVVDREVGQELFARAKAMQHSIRCPRLTKNSV